MADPRVVSLLPSATEVLCAIGGADLLVGRSHECDHPSAVADRPILTAARTRGGSSAEIDAQVRALHADADAGSRALYALDVERLRTLRPGVILTQNLCAVCSIDLPAVRAAAATITPAPTIVSLDPRTIEDVFDDMLRVGAAVGRAAAAEDAVVALRARYWDARDFVNPYVDGPRVLVLEWTDPLFVAGRWTPALVRAAGGTPVLAEDGAPSRPVRPEDVVAAAPERIVICPCGLDLAAIARELPALAAQPWWSELPAVREGRVACVDGNQMLSRPGPRLVDAFEWLVAWLNDLPDLVPSDFPWRPPSR